ncbi:hypothetical protein BH10PLA1_BH10PLA1_13490 [soil metagenome]
MATLELPHTPGCLVCGHANPVGLRLSLCVDTGDVAIQTTFTPGPQHIGFEGILHGGVLATVLDEAMVWAAIWSSRRACVAGEMNVRFRKSAVVGVPLKCTARVTASRSRLIESAGELVDATGQTIATATGKYVPLGAEPTQSFFQTLVAADSTHAATQLLTQSGNHHAQ